MSDDQLKKFYFETPFGQMEVQALTVNKARAQLKDLISQLTILYAATELAYKSAKTISIDTRPESKEQH